MNDLFLYLAIDTVFHPSGIIQNGRGKFLQNHMFKDVLITWWNICFLFFSNDFCKQSYHLSYSLKGQKFTKNGQMFKKFKFYSPSTKYLWKGVYSSLQLLLIFFSFFPSLPRKQNCAMEGMFSLMYAFGKDFRSLV